MEQKMITDKGKAAIAAIVAKAKAEQTELEAAPIDELPIEDRPAKPARQSEVLAVPQQQRRGKAPGRPQRDYGILSVESLTEVPPMPQAKFKGRVRSEGLKKAMRSVVQELKRR